MGEQPSQETIKTTRILVVDDDPDFARVARDVLRPQGFEVRATDSGVGAMALLRVGLPALMLISLDMPQGEGLRTIELLRSFPQGGQRVQVIGSSARSVDEDRDLRRALRRLRVSRVIGRPLSLLDLPTVVGEVLGETPPPEEASQRRLPSMSTLKELARIWCERDTGVANTASGLSGRFINGATADVDTLTFVDKILRDGLEMRFRRCGVHGQGDPETLAQRLWQAARALATQPMGESRMRRALAPSLFIERLEELPINPGLLRVVRTADGSVSLAQHVVALGLRVDELASDLAALELLGLLSFTDAPLNAPPRPTPIPASRGDSGMGARNSLPPGSMHTSSFTPPPRPQRAAPSDVDPTEALMLLKRLRKELARLEGADAFLVLGVPHNADPSVVRGAALRMRDRYRAIEGKTGVSDEVHRLARELVGLADVAEREALAAGPEIEPPPLMAPTQENESQAFTAGVTAMKRGDWALAARAFRAAHHSRIDSAPYMAHLGWAIFNDVARGRGRVEESLELLELADSFDSTEPQAQLWLAEVELAAGHADRAQARVGRVRRKHDLPQARDLAERIAQALKPAPPA